MFYADFFHYKQYGISISGLNYQAIKYGPVPVHYDTIYDHIGGVEKEIVFSHKVLDLVSSRQPAKSVPNYCLNCTPQEELDKLNVPHETIFVFRERGMGRPTKKDRRDIDSLMDNLFYGEAPFIDDDDEDDEE